MELRPLDDVEKCYWSREAFLRCLRACKWHYDNAVRRAEETCVWRREYNVEQLGADSISVEGETGKELVYGFDRQCRPVLYMVRERATALPLHSTEHQRSTRTGKTRKPDQDRSTSWYGVLR